MSIATEQPAWHLPKLVGFRFAFIYFVLYAFPFPLSYLPVIGGFTYKWMTDFYKAIVPWVGEHVLSISYPVRVLPSGSGDTTADFVILFVTFVLAIAGTLLWSLLDRKRNNYNKLATWFIIAVRYYLALMFLSYGFSKVIQTQFAYWSPMRLLTPYGHSSPMGLIWRMMGHSEWYNWFTGGGEVLAGYLLLFHRTRVLGAIVGFSVMINVAALNYCFDIPVKLASSHYTIMCLLLLIPNLKNLLNVMLFNKATEALPTRTLFQNKKLGTGLLVLKLLFIAYISYSNIDSRLQRQADHRERGAREAFGLYEITHYEVDGKVIPTDYTNKERYRYMAVEHWYMAFVDASYNRKYYQYENDAEADVLVLTDYRSREPNLLDYEIRGSQVIFEGYIGDKHVYMCTRKVEMDEFLMVNRGFNWINEQPFNR